MKELIPIVENGGIPAVNARDLHEFLEVGKDFSSWIKDRISKYGFIENEDFEVFTKIGENPLGGRPEIEYHLSFDMAKEISMVENNDQGRKARRYFIACENAVKSAREKAKSIRGKSTEARNALTDMWQTRGATTRNHFVNLTRAEYKALGYEKPQSVKKAGMSLREIGRLNALEALEFVKLGSREDIQGYYGLRDSIGETGQMLESFERKMIPDTARG